MADTFEMSIELGKAREFAAAVGYTGEIEVGSPVPPTFLQTSLFWSGPESSVWTDGRDTSRVLHGKQKFEFPTGPIRVGETLTGRYRIDATYEKRGKRAGLMTVTEEVIEFTNPAGELRALVRCVTLETEGAPIA